MLWPNMQQVTASIAKKKKKINSRRQIIFTAKSNKKRDSRTLSAAWVWAKRESFFVFALTMAK